MGALAGNRPDTGVTSMFNIRRCYLFLWYYTVDNGRDVMPYHYIQDDFGNLTIVCDPWESIAYYPETI